LQYTGGGQDSDRLFTLGTGNGTIDSSGFGPLNLNNTGNVLLSGTGARTLTLTGTEPDDNTLAAFIGDNGGATSLAKSGSGKWVLTGNNTNSGTVTIAAGTLQVGNGIGVASLGSGNVVDNGRLNFNITGAVTNGTITGTGALTLDGGGMLVLPGNNTYSGATTINAGTLQIGNGGASGTLNSGTSIVNNDTLIYNSTSTVNLNGSISGSGNVIVRKGTLQAIGNNSYAGWTQIDPGATFEPSIGLAGQLASSVVTNNGTFLLSRQDNNVFIYNGDIVGSGAVMKVANNGNNGDVTLKGNNTYAGGTYILGGTIIFGDNATPGAGSFLGDVYLTNDYLHNQFGGPPNDFVPAVLVFNRPDDFTFPGNIVGEGFVTLTGNGTVTLTGNNTYTNRGTGPTTTISAGTLQVGNGGASGSMGLGGVANNALLVFNRSGTLDIPGAFSGTGSVVNEGTGTVIMAGTNTLTGFITVSNGTLRISTMYQGNAPIFVQDGATLSVTNAGSTVSALAGGLTLGNAAGPSTVEFLNVADPTTRILNTSAGSLTVNGNATIKITGSGGLVAGNTYPLIGYSAITGGGTFSLSLPAGVTGTLTNDAVNSWIALKVTTAPFTPPKIQGATLSGTNIVITATNNLGSSAETYSLLSSTNIASAVTNWTVLSTGSFNPDGSLSITNPVGAGQRFFILRVP
jgi:fibronectin-binding autotransporter adhesin